MIRADARSVAIVGHHRDRVDRADLGAELAALAVLEVEAGEGLAVEHDRRVGAVEPAEQAVDAAREVDARLEAGPPAAGARLRGLARMDDAAGRELLPGAQLGHAYPSSTA